MNLRKTVFWPVRLLVLLAVTSLGASLPAAPNPVDPIVGSWIWRNNATVTFKVDGTAHHSGGADGEWKYLGNPEVQRHYRIVGDRGRSIDEVACAEDGLSGRVNVPAIKTQFAIRRALPDKPAVVPTPAPSAAPATPAAAVVSPTTAEVADPIVGEWQWPKGNSVTFAADGTMASAAGLQGVWMFLRNPEGRRKYVLDWKFGLYTDHMTYNRDARTGHLVNQKGDAFDVVQGAATSGKPAGYFGAPGN